MSGEGPQSAGWRSYGEGGRDRGVTGYLCTRDGILLRFHDGEVYRYTDTSAGAASIRRMQHLARSGNGLSTWINRHQPGFEPR